MIHPWVGPLIHLIMDNRQGVAALVFPGGHFGCGQQSESLRHPDQLPFVWLDAERVPVSLLLAY